MRAKIINRNSIEVISIESKLTSINMLYKSKIEELGVTDDVVVKLLSIGEDHLSKENKELLRKRRKLDEDNRKLLLDLDSYKEYIPSKEPSDLSEFDSVVPFYVEENGIIYQKWEVKHNDERKVKFEIERVKRELGSSDYKIVKCMEAKLSDRKIPYDLNQLTAERQEMRDRINQLEVLISE